LGLRQHGNAIENVAGPIADVGREEVQKGAQHQTGAANQNDGKSDLNHNQ
jgi:hypothetical protein